MKTVIFFLCTMLLTVCIFGQVNASMIESHDIVSVTQMAADSYVAAPGSNIIASKSNLSISHSWYYEWTLDDMTTDIAENATLDIVFHSIYNWRNEDNWLNVYIRDGKSTEVTGWIPGVDYQQNDHPNWTAWKHIGTWSDPDGSQNRYDVVYQLKLNEIWKNTISNDGTFVLGIDPDCHFYGKGITVLDPPALPVPGALMLLSSGLICMVALPRKS